MILKIRFWNWKFMFSCSQIEDIVGVNSKIDEENHVLMWDFDNVHLDILKNELQQIQFIYELPNIYVVQTKLTGSYHAYSLCKRSFREACAILTFSTYIDMVYYRLGVTRGYWTLRISEKSGRDITLVDVLKSDVPEDVTIKDLKSFVIYETLPDTARRKKIEIGENR